MMEIRDGPRGLEQKPQSERPRARRGLEDGSAWGARPGFRGNPTCTGIHRLSNWQRAQVSPAFRSIDDTESARLMRGPRRKMFVFTNCFAAHSASGRPPDTKEKRGVRLGGELGAFVRRPGVDALSLRRRHSVVASGPPMSVETSGRAKQRVSGLGAPDRARFGFCGPYTTSG